MPYRPKKPDYEAARLEVGTLARFADGLTWREILALDRSLSRFWWSNAVGWAEDQGLLWYDFSNGAWWLSDAGRLAVRDVA